MATITRVALVVSAVCVGGCTPDKVVTDDIVSTRSAEFNSTVLNGPVLQGPVLQGPVLQGPVLQGPVLQGIVLQGPVLQGPVLQGPVLQGTEFSGTVVVDGQELEASGEDFIGSEWNLRVGQVDEEGNELVEDYVLKFENIHLSDEQPDVYLYDIVHRPAGGGAWTPLCQDSQGGMVSAIPLHNYWNLETGDRVDDPNVITFACTNAVLAKCVLWGYRPWATATRCEKWDKNKNCSEMPLTDYHQACTRMARADYCGTGEPWTVPGTAIDLWDHLSPQVQTPTTNWFIEAEWTPEGATCLNDIRHPELKEQGLYPSCFLDKKGKPKKFGDCGSLKKHRALITSTFNNPGKNGKGGDCNYEGD